MNDFYKSIQNIDSSEQDGLKNINKILEILNDWLGHFSTEKSLQIIYRGITNDYGNLIRSGASIRLENTLSTNYSYSDYIAYHQKLIQQVKNSYPDSYKGWSDLEILADLQHNGAATCLVDFSKNILVSLWFACNDIANGKNNRFVRNNNNQTEKISESYGILYCYNITYDLLYENKLSIVTNQDIVDDISSLLQRTKKATNFCSDTVYSFMLWEPTVLNNRIARQDSVFLFGLNKFQIDKHQILQIKIPNSIKKSILNALNRFFNISATTIFGDKHGFATVNEKQKLLYNWESRSDLFTMGTTEMLSGNYEIALDFYMEYEIDKKYSMVFPMSLPSKQLELEELIHRGELYLSKAICLKNIIEKNQEQSYFYKNVIIEYAKAELMFKEVLKNIPSKFEDNSNLSKQESLKRKYNRYSRKILRIYNDILNIMYNAEEYFTCIQYCQNAIKIISIMKNGEEKMKAKDKSFKLDNTYSSVYCNIAIMELVILSYIKQEFDSEKNNYKKIWKNNKKKLNKLNLSNQSFEQLLVVFFDLVYYYICNPIKEYDNIKRKEDKFETCLENLKLNIFNKTNINTIKDYSTWDFDDLIKVVNASKFKNDVREKLTKWIGAMIHIRDLYCINFLNKNSELNCNNI